MTELQKKSNFLSSLIKEVGLESENVKPSKNESLDPQEGLVVEETPQSKPKILPPAVGSPTRAGLLKDSFRPPRSALNTKSKSFSSKGADARTTFLSGGGSPSLSISEGSERISRVGEQLSPSPQQGRGSMGSVSPLRSVLTPVSELRVNLPQTLKVEKIISPSPEPNSLKAETNLFKHRSNTSNGKGQETLINPLIKGDLNIFPSSKETINISPLTSKNASPRSVKPTNVTCIIKPKPELPVLLRSQPKGGTGACLSSPELVKQFDLPARKQFDPPSQKQFTSSYTMSIAPR